jgi:ELWxxDGT repeat protein
MSVTRSRLFFTLALVALALHPLAAQAQYKLKELRAGQSGTDTVFAGPNPGSSPDKFVEFKGDVYFFARFENKDGIEIFPSGLYRTDGTRANTTFVAYFEAIADMAVVNGQLLISGANEAFTSPPQDELELWGTTDGTTVTKVKDLRTGGIGSSPQRFFVWNNLLLFAADPNGLGLVLFVSDGTEAGTTSLDAYKDPQEFAAFGTKIFFTAKSLQTDAETRLWSWGGNPLVSAELVEDRVVGNLAVLGTSLYMTKRSGSAPRREGELWRTDGIPSTAVKVTSLWPGGHAAVAEKTVMGSFVYFTGCDPALGRNLYRTDGTAVTLVKDFLTVNPIPGVPPVAPANSCDVDYPASGPDRDPPNGPSQLAVINGKLYFEVDDGDHGRELWSSDGTPAGTSMVTDINPGMEPSDLLINAPSCGGAYCRAVTPSGFFFTASTRSEGRELWYCNGTTATLAAAVDPTARSGVPVGRLLFAKGTPGGDKVFFSGSDDDGNNEPWVMPVSPTLSVSDIRVSESAGSAGVVVRLSPPNPSATVTANWTTVAGSAAADSDFTTSSGTVSFAPGETQQLISVPIINDAALEGDETFTVRLSGASNAELPVPDAVVTIGDDSLDGPYLEVLAPVTPPNEGSPAVFKVRLTGAHADYVYVNYRTIAISATSPADFTRQTGTLTFAPVAAPPAPVEQTVSVATLNDTMTEDLAEAMALEIWGVRGATPPVPPGLPATPGAAVATRVATTSILDWDPSAANGFRDPVPGVSIGNASVTENNVFANLTVALTNPTDRTVRVYWSTPDSVTLPALPATPDVDFRNASGFITFRPGQTSKTITLDVYTDGIDEGNELVYAELDPASAANGGVYSGRGVLTIVDDDTGVLSVGNATVTEGDSGNVNATFTISLSVPFYQDFTVNYATSDLTATAGLDYVAQSGVLYFPMGTTQRTVTVPVIGDLLDEPNETFRLTVSGSSGPDTGATRVATGTILDDDTSISISNASVTEGNTGTTDLTFTVSMPEVYRNAVTVAYATSEGGGASLATSGTDFVPATGSVTIPQGSKTATFNVAAIGDLIDENAETFLVTLSNSSGPLILNATGIGTINDNDTSAVSINSLSVPEGDAGTADAVFTLTLSTPYYRDFTVDWTTAAGLTNPATAGLDYTASSGTVTFPALSTRQTLAVPVIGDTIDETNETFRVTFSNSTGPGPTTGTGTATIVDDDAQVIGVQDVSVVEGNSGTTPAVFTLTTSRDHEQPIAVTVATTGGGPTPPAATSGTDFTALAPTVVTFAPGVNSQPVSVNVIGDTLVEANNESFGLALSAPTAGATLARTKALGIILDDDSSRTVSLSPLTLAVQEPATGTTTVSFTAVLNVAAANTVTVNYATANGTATAGADYTAAAGTISFDPGESSKTIPVQVLADAPAESPETFTLTLSSPTNATLVPGASVATATITDPLGPVGGLYTLTPCRVVDTRVTSLGGPNPLVGGSATSAAMWSHCGIPPTARAIAVNVTVAAPTAGGYLTIYPSGIARPVVSVVNYSKAQVRANNAILALGATGGLTVYVGQPTTSSVHVIIDVNGYLE